MHEPVSTTSLLAHGSLAFFGAVVHALNAHRSGKSKTPADFIALTLMSSFSGVMFALIAFTLSPDNIYLTMAIAGTGGFLGIEGMALIVDRVRNFISSK